MINKSDNPKTQVLSIRLDPDTLAMIRKKYNPKDLREILERLASESDRPITSLVDQFESKIG